MTKYAPGFLSAFVDSRAIQSLMTESLGHLTYTACQLARHPELAGHAIIDTGFGGSDSSGNSLRNPAYTIPALILWDNLDKTLKNVERLENLDPQPRPALRFFWAIHAGIALNGKDETATLKNAQTQMRLVSQFINYVRPEAYSRTFVETDIPWDQLSADSQSVFAYIIDLIKRADDDMVVSAVENLYRRGKNHVNGLDPETAALTYAAYHNFIFHDPMPFEARVFKTEFDADFRISIGSRAEKQFNPIRRYISNRANLDEFITFCQTHNLPYQEALSDVISSKANAMLIGTVGNQSPPYYLVNGVEDRLLYESLNHPREIIDALDQLETAKTQAQRQLSGADRKIAIQRIKAVQSEFALLITFSGGMENFIDYLESLNL